MVANVFVDVSVNGKKKYQLKLLMKDKDLKKKIHQKYLKDFIVIDLKNLENIQA